MDKEYRELMEKFDKVMAGKPTESEAIEFWSKLSSEEYDRLIYIFENNKIKGLNEDTRLKLIETFKTLRNKLSQINQS